MSNNDFEANPKEVSWLLDEKYGGVESEAFWADVKRIENGEPLAYIIGHTEFLGTSIDLSQKTLIPRPETEYWTQKFLEKIEGSFGGGASEGDNPPISGGSTSGVGGETANLKVLDMFAGSGCVGVSVLKHFPGAHVTFADISGAAVEQIKINTESFDESRYKIVKSDLFGKVRGKFDYILANPPYIPQPISEQVPDPDEVQESVHKYEPHEALYSGKDGLDLIKKFLNSAHKHLNKEGQIWLEFGSDQKQYLSQTLEGLTRYSDWQFHCDQYDKDRFVVISI